MEHRLESIFGAINKGRTNSANLVSPDTEDPSFAHMHTNHLHYSEHKALAIFALHILCRNKFHVRFRTDYSAMRATCSAHLIQIWAR